MEYDVIVVGAGPAGSSCAIFLGRKNIKTLLVDKASFPRDKICGDGITGKSIKVLEELGIDEKIKALQYASIKGFISSASPTSLFTVEGDPAYACKRYFFDNMIFGEAKKVVDVIENFTATDLVMDNDKVTGIKGVDKDGNEKEFHAKIVVGADGSTSVVARKLGLNSFQTNKLHVAIRAYYENVDIDENLLELHFIDEIMPGYFWIFPVGNNVSNVGVGMLAEEIQKRKLNLKDELEKIIKNSYMADKFKNAKQVSEIKGWNLPTGAQKRKRAGDGFLLVGDAASLIDPFTGEGIGNALLSGKLASETIKNALGKNDFSNNILKAYEAKIEEHMAKEFETNYRFQKFGKNALMFNALVEELSADKNSMKAATSAFSDTTHNTQNFQIPIGLYVRVFVRYLKDYVKLKFGGKRLIKQIGHKN